MVKEKYKCLNDALESYLKQGYIKTPLLHPVEWYEEHRQQFTLEPEVINPRSDFNEFIQRMNSEAIKVGKCDVVLGCFSVAILDDYMTIQRAHAKAYEDMKVHGADVFGEEYDALITEVEKDILARRRVEMYEYNMLQLKRFAESTKKWIVAYLSTCVYPLDAECLECKGVKTCEYHECCNK